MATSRTVQVFGGPTVFEGPDFANGTRVKAHVRSGGVAAVV